PYAHRHALPVFPAGADTLIELQIVANHRDAGEHVWPVADQGSATHRRGHLSILDQIGLARGEDELAIRDIYLAAAEVHGVKAALHAANDVLGLLIAGQHVGVCHARHRDVLVTLAASVAGVGHLHQA